MTVSELLMRNIADKTFEGFSDPQLREISPLRGRFKMIERLVSGAPVDGVPFPFDLAVIRALHLGRAHRLGSTEEEYVAALRFGVCAPHLQGVEEVTYEEFQAGFDQVKCQRDVPMIREDEGARALIEWASYGFYHVPRGTSDALWDLFRMEESECARPAFFQAADELKAGRVRQVPTPVMVSRTRNKELVENLRSTGRECPVVGMGHFGSALSLTLLLCSEDDSPGDELFFPLLGLGNRLRREEGGQGGQVWVIATYTPPPVVRGEWLLPLEETGDHEYIDTL